MGQWDAHKTALSSALTLNAPAATAGLLTDLTFPGIRVVFLLLALLVTRLSLFQTAPWWRETSTKVSEIAPFKHARHPPTTCALADNPMKRSERKSLNLMEYIGDAMKGSQVGVGQIKSRVEKDQAGKKRASIEAAILADITAPLAIAPGLPALPAASVPAMSTPSGGLRMFMG